MVLIGPQKVIRNNSPRSRWSNRENGDLNYKLWGSRTITNPNCAATSNIIISALRRTGQKMPTARSGGDCQKYKTAKNSPNQKRPSLRLFHLNFAFAYTAAIPMFGTKIIIINPCDHKFKKKNMHFVHVYFIII